MKGLLLKEWYMMKKYCRIYLVFAVVCLAVSSVNGNRVFFGNNAFFLFYPCLLCGMIPVNLLGFDEQSGWIRYSGTLPYTKTQLVTAKYLTALFVLFAYLAATALLQTVSMALNGEFYFANLSSLLLAMFIIAASSVSVCLPLIFKYGTEKGRIVYLCMVGMYFGGYFAVSEMFSGNLNLELPSTVILLCVTFAVVGLFALS